MKDRSIRTSEYTPSSSDDNLTAEAIIRGRFQRSPFLPLRRISCVVDDGVLSLRGRVPTYYLKQLAQTIGASIQGVHQVCNELQVDFPEVTGDV